MLGWRLATAAKKRLPFSKTFVSLGVQVDLSMAGDGIVLLSHKPGRIDNLEEQIQAVTDADTMTFKEALSIRGKVFYSEGQVFGRLAAPVVYMLSRWSVISWKLIRGRLGVSESRDSHSPG